MMRDKILSQNGKEYWRSVEEFVDAPEFEEFVKREYPAQSEEWDNALSRRNFVKVMGASLGACRSERLRHPAGGEDRPLRSTRGGSCCRASLISLRPR